MSFLHLVSVAMGMICYWSIRLIISLFSLIITKPMLIEECTLSLERCCFYLNSVDPDWYPAENSMTELEARAFEDYLHKINEALVRRGPVTFEIFKDIVSKPITWERYCQPVRRRKGQVSSAWNYKLNVSINTFPNPSLLFFYLTPFSCDSGSFRWQDYIDIRNPNVYGEHKWSEYWFKIRNWLDTLNLNSMTLPGDRPGTDLYEFLERWRNSDPWQSPFRLQSKLKSSRLLPIIKDPHTLVADVIPQVGLARKPAPTHLCEFRIYKRPSGDYGMDPWIEGFLFSLFECWNEVDPAHLKLESTESPVSAAPAGQLLSVASTEVGPAAKNCAIVEEDDIIETVSDRRFGRAAVATESRLSRSFSSDTDEDHTPEEVRLIQSARKSQKVTDDFEFPASDTDSIMTEVDNGPPDSSYEDDMSDDDFWSAKSTAELSLLSLD